MVVKFVYSIVLFGVVDEIGFFCGVVVYVNFRISVEVFFVFIMCFIVFFFVEFFFIGFSGDGVWIEGVDFKVWVFLIFVNRNVVIL